MTKLIRSSFFRALLAALAALLFAPATLAVDFARNFGGPGVTSQANGFARDSAGNTYLTGFFNTANFTNPAMTRIGTQDGFVIKVDPAGAPVWARNFSGAGTTLQLAAVAVDGSGNVYVTGFFQTADPTTPPLTRIGTKDAVLIKLDSSGNLVWTRNFGGPGATCQGLGVAVDTAGNVTLTGFFNAASLTTPALTKIGSQDMFLIRTDSTGAVTWAKNFGGVGATVQGNSVALDGSGNAYLALTINAANLTTPPITRIGARDMAIFKLDSTGAVTWTRNFGGSGANANGIAVALGGTSDVYLAGHFFGADLTNPPFTRIGGTDGVVIRLDTAGSTVWAKNVGGTAGAVNVSVATLTADAAGNAYLGGFFQSGNLTTPPLVIHGADDAYAIKLDARDGTPAWATSYYTNTTITFTTGLAVDGAGALSIGGYFFGTTLQGTPPPMPTKIGTTDVLLVQQSTSPDPPAIGTATPGDGQALVTFTAPSITGGGTITGYTVTSDPSGVIATGASPVIVTGLTNGTAYTFTVTATTAIGTSLPSVTSNSVTPLAAVVSFTAPSATGGGNITAAFVGGDPGCTFSAPAFIPLTGNQLSPPAGSAPAGVTFPFGLFSFSTTACTPGSTLTFTLTYPAAVPPGTQYWKYGPTSGNPAPHWYVIPSAIAGNVITFSITDGGLGDDDLLANGTIVDQGGPGVGGGAGNPGTRVPTLSQWALVLLALLMLGFAARRTRRSTS